MDEDNNIDLVWGVLASILEEFNFNEIKTIVGIAGLNRSYVEEYTEREWNGSSNISKQGLVSKVGIYFFDFKPNKKQHFLNIVIEEVISRKNKLNIDYDLEIKLEEYLNRLGWQLIDNKVLPIQVLELSDLNELDLSSKNDLVKAATKFRDGDLSGAITSACAAVDSVTAKIYQDKNLDDFKNTSFQERCNKSLTEVGVFKTIDAQLNEVSWKEGNITQFKDNLKKSLNQAAYVMQALRSDMSDVHGTKPVVKALAFDTIKWAQIIIRLLSKN